MDLTDEQWVILAPMLPKKEREVGQRGRPWQESRTVLNGILWVLRTGAPWKDLPDRYPPYQTCHRRFQAWVRNEILIKMLKQLAEDLCKRGKLDLSETYIDGSFSSAKKGALELVRRSVAKGPRSWQLQTAMVYLSRVGLKALALMKHEIRLVKATIKSRFTRQKPKKLIGDLAYDSDPLDKDLSKKMGIELIAPHKINRVKPKTQDGRVLRRYRNRWRVERLFAWLQNFRRVVIRWERYAQNFLGMLQLGCIRILLRYS